jgi:dihydropteroate synthase
MAAAGAAIIDVGGESTRPGAEAVSSAEQISRVVPVIEELAGKTDRVISVDTRVASVAEAAIRAGAAMVNDVKGGEGEGMLEVCAEAGVGLVLMHMRAEPATMVGEARYDDVVGEVLDYLLARAAEAEAAGVLRERIFIDPGIGFAKTTEHNLKLLKHVGRFVESGYRVLVGTSRKRFIGEITGRAEASERLMGTAGTVAWCAAAGVDIMRVHDVVEMGEILKMIEAIKIAD